VWLYVYPADLQPFSKNHIQSETNGLLAVENDLIYFVQDGLIQKMFESLYLIFTSILS